MVRVQNAQPIKLNTKPICCDKNNTEKKGGKGSHLFFFPYIVRTPPPPATRLVKKIVSPIGSFCLLRVNVTAAEFLFFRFACRAS